METIVQSLARIVERHPSSPALTWRNSTWSYSDLAAAIEAAAARVLSYGYEPGTRVALLSRNSPQYVASCYGVLAAGHVVVPLNVQERVNVLARQIEHAGAKILLGDPEHAEWAALAASSSHVQRLEIRATDALDAVECFVKQMIGQKEQPTPCVSELADLAAIIYTSGTTGKPKGVMLSHGNFATNTQAIIEYLGIEKTDRNLCVLPFHFSYGSSVLNSHLLSGAHLVIEDNLAFPHLLLRRMQDQRITGFAGVPSTYALILGRCRLHDFDLSSLRYLTQAGGPMPSALVDKLRTGLPNAKLYVMYGQTEATARLTYLPPEQLDRKRGSVGIPVSGVEIEVRKDGAALTTGEVGEICARGPNVMLGYWREPALTAEVLKDGWLHTGDLGHIDADGFLSITGRTVDMIKVGAFRVSPQEIEEVLAAMPAVEEVAVTGVADEVLGQAIKAVIVPRLNEQVDVLAVKAHCRERLAGYKIPKVIEFAQSLPRTSSGKVQRFRLT